MARAVPKNKAPLQAISRIIHPRRRVASELPAPHGAVGTEATPPVSAVSALSLSCSPLYLPFAPRWCHLTKSSNANGRPASSPSLINLKFVVFDRVVRHSNGARWTGRAGGVGLGRGREAPAEHEAQRAPECSPRRAYAEPLLRIGGYVNNSRRRPTRVRRGLTHVHRSFR